MKLNYLPFVLFFMLVSINVNAQKPVAQKPVINIRGIGTYHSLKELEGLLKGELITLYLERIKIIVNIVPYVGITNKPGVTLKDLGIPETVENVKALDRETENKNLFVSTSYEFLTTMLPYSDKSSIIQGILFYEDVLKKIHSGDEL